MAKHKKLWWWVGGGVVAAGAGYGGYRWYQARQQAAASSQKSAATVATSASPGPSDSSGTSSATAQTSSSTGTITTLTPTTTIASLDTSSTSGTAASGGNTPSGSGASGVPSAVTGIAATATAQSPSTPDGIINLSWNAAEGATSYIVYQMTLWGEKRGCRTIKSLMAVSSTSGTSVELTGLPPSLYYYYVVVPVNAVGQGPVSTVMMIAPIPPGYTGTMSPVYTLTLPTPMSNLQAAVGGAGGTCLPASAIDSPSIYAS